MGVKASAYIVDHLDVVLEIIKGRSHVGSHCSLLGVGYRKNGEQDVSTGAKHALGVSARALRMRKNVPRGNLFRTWLFLK